MFFFDLTLDGAAADVHGDIGDGGGFWQGKCVQALHPLIGIIGKMLAEAGLAGDAGNIYFGLGFQAKGRFIAGFVFEKKLTFPAMPW